MLILEDGTPGRMNGREAVEIAIKLWKELDRTGDSFKMGALETLYPHMRIDVAEHPFLNQCPLCEYGRSEGYEPLPGEKCICRVCPAREYWVPQERWDYKKEDRTEDTLDFSCEVKGSPYHAWSTTGTREVILRKRYAIKIIGVLREALASLVEAE